MFIFCYFVTATTIVICVLFFLFFFILSIIGDGANPPFSSRIKATVTGTSPIIFWLGSDPFPSPPFKFFSQLSRNFAYLHTIPNPGKRGYSVTSRTFAIDRRNRTTWKLKSTVNHRTTRACLR